jgi:hypothetical protein
MPEVDPYTALSECTAPGLDVGVRREPTAATVTATIETADNDRSALLLGPVAL